MRFPFRHLAIRFYWWLILKVARRAGDIQRFAILIAVTRIRIQFEFPLPGEDENLDDGLIKIVRTYFCPEMEAQTPISESECPGISEWLKADSLSDNDRKMYFRVSHWFATRTHKEDESHNIASAYQSIYGKNLEPIDISDIWKSRSEFRERFRVEYRTLRESKAQLINLRLQEFTPLLPWLSLSFVIAGYLHTYWVYSPFGIDVDQFFSLNDYLANSIEEIHHAVIGLIAYFLGALNGFRNYTTWTKYDLRRIGRHDKLDIGISLMLLSSVLSLWYMGIIMEFYIRLVVPICLLALVQTRVQRLIMRYFSNFQYVFFLLIFFVLFLSSLYISARIRVADIKKGNSGTNFEIETGSQNFTHENSTFIGANTRYIFVRIQNGSVEIIPIGKAERIEISAR